MILISLGLWGSPDHIVKMLTGKIIWIGTGVLVLALQYRPRSFDDIAGQRAVTLVLGRMVSLGRVPQGLLFSGSKGTGKTTISRIVGAALNCEELNKPCGKCDLCESVFVGNSLDVIEIDAASSGGVAGIRSLTDMLVYQSAGQHRVVILDEAHALTNEAFKALLKTLEEPPPQTTFIFVTTESHKIPDTIKSRLMGFEFSLVSVDDIVDRLMFICEHESLKTEIALLKVIARRANGSVRDATMTLDQISRADIFTLVEFNEHFEIPDFGPKLIEVMLSGDVASVFSVVESQLVRHGNPHVISDELIETLREIMVLHAAGTLPYEGPSLDARRAISARCELDRAFRALQILWQLGTKTGVSQDPRVALDLALVMCTEALSGKLHTKPIKKVSPALSLKEMNSM